MWDQAQVKKIVGSIPGQVGSFYDKYLVVRTKIKDVVGSESG